MYQSPVFQWGKNFIDKLDLSKVKTILDVGCRKGDLSVHLAMRYEQKRIIAIDNIKTEIERARAHRLHNLTFETIDALHLDFANTFDAIVSFSCFHWIKNKYQTLRNIYQALKPGGKVYFQFFAIHGRPKNDRFIYQVAQSSDWKYYFDACFPAYSEITVADFSLLLQKTGFLIHSLEVTKHNTPFEHADQLQNWLKTWVSQASYVPKQKQDYFLNDVTHRYLDAHRYTYDVPFPYYEYLLEVVCEKPIEPVQIENMDKIRLTKREQEILKSYLKGKTAKEIAVGHDVSPKTVEFHLANIKKKLNCYRRSHIYETIVSYGLTELLV